MTIYKTKNKIKRDSDYQYSEFSPVAISKIIEQNKAAELLIICIWFIWFTPNGFMMINIVIWFSGYMV